MSKNTRIITAGILILCLAVSSAFSAARTRTITETTTKYDDGWRITHIAWTADSLGVFADTTTSAVLRGEIIRIVTVPDTTMVPADSTGLHPTDDYDITLKNAIGVDIAGGSLASRDSVNTESSGPMMPSTLASGTSRIPWTFFNNSKLTISITKNSVPSARGNIYIYWKAK